MILYITLFLLSPILLLLASAGLSVLGYLIFILSLIPITMVNIAIKKLSGRSL